MAGGRYWEGRCCLSNQEKDERNENLIDNKIAFQSFRVFGFFRGSHLSLSSGAQRLCFVIVGVLAVGMDCFVARMLDFDRALSGVDHSSL